MKLFKTLAIAGLGLLMVAGLQAQLVQPTRPGTVHKTQTDTVFGKAGQAIILKEYLGQADEIYLSANGKYIIGKTGEGADVGEEAGFSFIYELESGNSVFYNDRIVAEAIDFNNYVSTKSIVRNGREINYNTQGLVCSDPIYASQDLNVIVRYAKIANSLPGHNPYTMVVFDGNGNLIDTMPHYEAELTSGHGSMLWALSPDGQIGAGKSSINGAFTNNSPAFWDRTIDETFSLADMSSRTKRDGSLYGVSYDGTLLTGDRGDIAIYVNYNRTSHTYSVSEILPEPGYGMSVGSHVEDGVVIGFDQRESVDVYGRYSWLYFMNEKRKVTVNDYLTELYGLQMEPDYPIFSPGKFTRDLRLMVGTTYDQGAWLGYIVLLDEHQIFAMPRAAAVRQIRGTANVEIKWQTALKGEYTLQKYIIYCDSTKVGEVPVGTTENYVFTHSGVESGTHNYQVQAVYEGGVSEYTTPARIQVIGEGETLPVREISSTTTYNRTVRVAWGVPSSIVSKSPSSAKKAAAKYVAQNGLDRISSFNTNIESASAAVLVGNYIYVSDYRNNSISAFNTLNGAREAAVNIEGMGLVYDMICHDKTFYSVGLSEHICEVKLRDENHPDSLTLTNRYEVENKDDVSRGLTHIAYIEGEDGAEDMLMAGSYYNMFFYKTDGSGDLVAGSDTIAKRFDISNLTISGSAYHKGRLYLSNQADDAHTPTVEVFDFKTGEHLFTCNVAEAFPEIAAVADYPGYDLSAGGLTVGTLDDGTVVLEFMTQPLVTYNYLATLEIESSSDIAGYNLYRNGEKLNENLLQTRHYVEEITAPGVYKYTVEVQSTAGYRAMDTNVYTTAYIVEIGDCEAPKISDIMESNEMAVIEWEFPEYSDGLVGFNIYRDGISIAKDVVTNKFVDRRPGKGEHMYYVEAFYDNSCVAFDSMKVNITFEGQAMPPAAVRFSYSKEEGKETNTHTTSWEAPFFEEPMSMGYCGIVGYSQGFDGSTTLYGVIGWRAADMGTFDDLYLVGMECVLGVEVNRWNAVVYVDDVQVYNQPIKEPQQPREWVQTYLSQNFPMKQKTEIAVGFEVQIKKMNDPVFCFDAGPVAARGKSDLISPDGITFYSAAQSGTNANLAINALVVRKRDLDSASKSGNPQAYIESKVMRLSSESVKMTEPKSFEGVKTTSEAYTLKGFNVYRDEEQVNDTLITEFSFVETGMIPGTYTYEVSAVYANDIEEFSEPLDVNTTGVANRPEEAVCPVSFLPNPVQDMLYIKGEYASLSLIDITGRVVLSDVRNAQSLSMANLQSGIYFVKVTTENEQVYITKIVKK